MPQRDDDFIEWHTELDRSGEQQHAQDEPFHTHQQWHARDPGWRTVHVTGSKRGGIVGSLIGMLVLAFGAILGILLVLFAAVVGLVLAVIGSLARLLGRETGSIRRNPGESGRENVRVVRRDP